MRKEHEEEGIEGGEDGGTCEALLCIKSALSLLKRAAIEGEHTRDEHPARLEVGG